MVHKAREFATRGTTLEDVVRCGRDSQAVVYDNFSGFPLKVTFLDGRWWVTTTGKTLQPLEDYYGDDDFEFIYLCEAGGRVDALALACMLGKAMENPEDNVSKCLARRLKELKRVGVELDIVEGDPLSLELRVFSNKGTRRGGNYSAWCYATEECYEKLFDIDEFDSQADAESWADCYFEFLREIGIDFNVTKVVRG